MPFLRVCRIVHSHIAAAGTVGSLVSVAWREWLTAVFAWAVRNYRSTVKDGFLAVQENRGILVNPITEATNLIDSANLEHLRCWRVAMRSKGGTMNSILGTMKGNLFHKLCCPADLYNPVSRTSFANTAVYTAVAVKCASDKSRYEIIGDVAHRKTVGFSWHNIVLSKIGHEFRRMHTKRRNFISLAIYGYAKRVGGIKCDLEPCEMGLVSCRERHQQRTERHTSIGSNEAEPICPLIATDDIKKLLVKIVFGRPTHLNNLSQLVV